MRFGDWWLASNIATTIFRPSGSNHSTRPASAFCLIRIIPDPSLIHSLFGRPICSARSEERPRSGAMYLSEAKSSASDPRPACDRQRVRAVPAFVPGARRFPCQGRRSIVGCPID
jgi:hypothetical protein